MTAHFSQVVHRAVQLAYVWKLVMGGTVFAVSMVVFNDSAKASDGEKAAFLAFGAACILIIDLLPNTPGMNGVIVQFLARCFGAVLGVLAAWFWISSETAGNMGVYLPVFGVFTTMVAVSMVLSSVLPRGR